MFQFTHIQRFQIINLISVIWIGMSYPVVSWGQWNHWDKPCSGSNGIDVLPECTASNQWQTCVLDNGENRIFLTCEDGQWRYVQRQSQQKPSFTIKATVSHRENVASASEILLQSASSHCQNNEKATLASDVREIFVDHLNNVTVEAEFECHSVFK